MSVTDRYENAARCASALGAAESLLVVADVDRQTETDSDLLNFVGVAYWRRGMRDVVADVWARSKTLGDAVAPLLLELLSQA